MGSRMRWFTYDCEVFNHDFIVVFKDRDTGFHYVCHNVNDAIREFITAREFAIFCGFNTKGYDQYIIKAICGGLSPEEVKEVNDWIIGGGQGWQCPLLDGVFFRFNNVDIMDDMQMGLSLKAFEGHLGELSIEETEVDFNLDRYPHHNGAECGKGKRPIKLISLILSICLQLSSVLLKS